MKDGTWGMAVDTDENTSTFEAYYGQVVIAQPTRHATGDRLVYAAAEDKFVLTGGSSGGSPSIFDAERGKITGDSLTLFGQGDRVVVQSRNKSQMVIQTRVTK